MNIQETFSSISLEQMGTLKMKIIMYSQYQLEGEMTNMTKLS